MVRLEFVLGAVAGVVIGCGVNQSFACQSSADCRSAGANGACEATGFCSFPDADCPSGSRYAEYAGDGLASTCVDETAATGDSDDGPNPAIVTFGERLDADYEGVTQDTFITGVSVLQTVNGGAHEDLHICGGTAAAPVALLRFDIEALAPDTVIASAEIEMYPDAGNSGSDVFDTFVMLESWAEGTRDLDPGVANFVEREPSVPWSAAGAAPPSREAVSLGTTDPTNTPGVPFTITIPASVVQAWVDAPATNFGLAMTALDPSCNAVLLSADYPEPARRPLLRLTLDGVSRR